MSELDILGDVCPYPLIKVRAALQNVPPGDVLEVVTDWETAVTETIPNLCRADGHSVQTSEDGPGRWRLRIVKNGGRR